MMRFEWEAYEWAHDECWERAAAYAADVVLNLEAWLANKLGKSLI